MDTIFQLNRAIVASLSGQAFFIIGLLAAWELHRYSRLPLARPLWMLAAFGLLYAFSEWGRLFIPIQHAYLPSEAIEVLRLLRVLLLAASFGALLQFGIELLPARTGLASRGAAGPVRGLDRADDRRRRRPARRPPDARRRRAPGARLPGPAGRPGCALGLVFQERYLLPLGGKDLARWLHLTALAAGLTALTLGLMVPAWGWAGTTSVLGVPAEVWRSLAGLLFALGLARTLAVFQLEQDRRLEAAEQERDRGPGPRAPGPRAERRRDPAPLRRRAAARRARRRRPRPTTRSTRPLASWTPASRRCARDHGRRGRRQAPTHGAPTPSGIPTPAGSPPVAGRGAHPAGLTSDSARASPATGTLRATSGAPRPRMASGGGGILRNEDARARYQGPHGVSS
jgi:hypothetical protein